MKGCKIVADEEGKLYSCWAGGKSRVQYKIGEFVKAPTELAAKGYHLLFFSSLRYTKNFVEQLLPEGRSFSISFRVYTCEAKGVLSSLPRYEALRFCEDAVVIVKGGSHWSSASWLRGTKMAKQIKLLEEIKL
jgi:hypothetical protein